MATKIIMPQLGESVVEGTVVKWLFKEGDRIKEYDILLEISTDKVATEIPSPASGTVLRLLVNEGETVKAGTVIAWIGEPGEEITPAEDAPPAAQMPARVSTQVESAVAAAPAVADRDMGFISPVVARLAHEKNVDLRQVKGSGEGGRITKKDVLAFIGQETPPSASTVEAPAWETPGEGDLFRPTELMFPAGVSQPAQPAPLVQPAAASTAPPVAGLPGDKIIPLSVMRKAIADHMSLSKHVSPHVTTVMEADMSRVAAHRDANKAAFARDGIHLTFTSYFIAAAAAALKAFPLVNSSWTEQGIALHSAVNIGMATSLGEEGLIVPVIRGVDGLSLLGIARAIVDLAERARSHRLLPDEVRGGTFTLTNHGSSSSLFATPIINQPQCAILGTGLIQKRVMVVNDAIAIRPMVYLGLTFDHRILDGASADGFLNHIVRTLQEWT